MEVIDYDEVFSNISLNLNNTVLPRAYGLFKIHKENLPIRIIVSSINSPLYSFDKSISLFFNKYLIRPKSYVKNSLEIKNLITNKLIPQNYKLISLDVVSLFPNLPHNLILQALSKKWPLLCKYIPLTKKEFLDGMRFLLSSTYIQFNQKFYLQTTGAPMGFCTSPWFADITLEALENNALQKLKCNLTLSNNNYFLNPDSPPKECILLYKRFVDDCLLVVEENKVDEILQIFNTYSDDLKFTIEYESYSNSISFLDLQITRILNNRPITNWYKKPTYSGRYINFLSHHPLSLKKAIIYSLVDKSVALASPQFHNRNLELTRYLLKINNYPSSLIDSCIKNALCSYLKIIIKT